MIDYWSRLQCWWYDICLLHLVPKVSLNHEMRCRKCYDQHIQEHYYRPQGTNVQAKQTAVIAKLKQKREDFEAFRRTG